MQILNNIGKNYHTAFLIVILMFILQSSQKKYNCQAGEYLSNQSCNSCPPGNQCPGNDSIEICAAGTYSGSGASSCTLCTAGTYSQSGSEGCTVCSNGYISNSAASVCKEWPSGQSNDVNHQNCIDCPEGSFGKSGICYSICGDGKKASDEPCDDNNKADGDGCSSSCTIENGYVCKQISNTSPSTCNTVCGDGKRAGKPITPITSLNLGTEACDDGNLNNGDGCSSACKIETGAKCVGGSPTTSDTCNDTCGDGIVKNRTPDNCDDGNTNDGDGCSSTCNIEKGWDCSGGSISTPDQCSTKCGDGVLTLQNEQCDDGNRKNGDGCDSSCQIEEGCTCTTNYNDAVNSICSEICGDGLNIGINPCDDGNNKSGDGCSSTCRIEAGFKCTGGSITKKDTCTEICGDGKNLGYNECDDGNTQDGDGCSAICEYEMYYECVNGTTSVNKCSKLYITPTINSISSSNTIVIGFNYTMKQVNITFDYLSVSIAYDYTIVFSWSAYYLNESTLEIRINSQTVLTGNEKINIKFINYKAWRGPNGGDLTTYSLSVNAQNSLIDVVSTAYSMSIYAQYFSYAGIIISFGLVLLGGKSLEMMWALINTLQIICYLPLMTPFFPEPVRVMFQILKFANMNFKFLSDLFNEFVAANLKASEYSELFTQNGIKSPLLILNCGSILFALICYIIIFLLVLVLYKICCCECLKTKIEIVISSFIFNNFIRFFIEGYLELSIFSVLNAFSLRMINNAELTSFLISCVFMTLLFLFPFMSAALLYDKRKDIANENMIYLKRFGTIYQEFKQDHEWYCLQFYPVFLLRRCIFTVMIVTLEGIPEIQCNIFILSSVLVLIYVYNTMPYKHPINNLLIVINESSLLIIGFIQVVFYTNLKSKEVIVIAGWIMIAVCILNILINFILCILYNIRVRILKCRKTPIQNIFEENNSPNNPQFNLYQSQVADSSIVANTILNALGTPKILNSSSLVSTDNRNNQEHHQPVKRRKIFKPGDFSSVVI